MNGSSLPTLPVSPDVAGFAFASGADSQESRSLAWASPADLGIDLDDPAQRCFGDYELLELIGQGGMGAVYRARQHNLDREVALKFLAAGPWASDEFIARFRREARAAARMQHPNIVEIHDTGVRDGLYFFSMRLVRGPTLAQYLREHGPMPIGAAATMMRTIAEAIDYAHRLGVLHLDLKPGNVLLGTHGEPLVADFGLARRIDDGPSEHDSVSGTPSYMAPEQAMARAQIGPAADIYGLGAVFHEMLTGEPPFRGRDAGETLRHVLVEEPPAPRSKRRDVPADLDAICVKCLAKDPAARYPDARALADDLGRFLAGDVVSARAPRWPERIRRWIGRNRLQSTAVVALLAGVVISGVGLRRAEQALAELAKQSQRSERMTELFAVAFARPGDGDTEDAMQASASRVVRWLRDRIVGDEQAQGDVLVGLIDSLQQADNPHAAQALIEPLIAMLGAEYRQEMAEALIAAPDLRTQMLGVFALSEDSDAARERKRSLLGRLMESPPADLDLLAAATYHCSAGSACESLGAPMRLVARQPGNAANWVFAMRADADPASAAADVHRAAIAEQFDDHFVRVFRLGFEAVESSGVAVPTVLRRAIEQFNRTVSPGETVGWYQAWSLPLPSWQGFTRACRPDGPAEHDPMLRADCLTVARRAMASSGSLMTRLVGSAVLRNLMPGTPEALQAREIRRDYVYTYDMLQARTPDQMRRSEDELVARETIMYGELEATKRLLDRAGIPRDPPADWTPSDPVRLMTGLERDAYRSRLDQLVRQPQLPPRPASLPVAH